MGCTLVCPFVVQKCSLTRVRVGLACVLLCCVVVMGWGGQRQVGGVAYIHASARMNMIKGCRF